MSFAFGQRRAPRQRRSTASAGLTALALVCTVRNPSATAGGELLLGQLLDELTDLGVAETTLRVVDLDADPADGSRPGVHDAIATTDLLFVAAPTWLGSTTSTAQQIIDRLGPELPEPADLAGKVAAAAVVGDRHGARQIIKDFAYGLTDLGFTVPSPGGIYWDGQTLVTDRDPTSVTDRDPVSIPAAIRVATHALARDAVRLARQNAAARGPV